MPGDASSNQISVFYREYMVPGGVITALLAASVIAIHLAGQPVIFAGLEPLPTFMLMLTLSLAALNLALNIPTIGHTSLSGPERQREIWIYNFRSAATRFPLVIGFSIALITPIETGVVAMAAGLVSFVALSAVHLKVDNRDLAAASRRQYQQRDYRQSQKDCIQAAKLIEGAAPVEVRWWTAPAGWVFYVLVSVGTLTLLKLMKPAFGEGSLTRMLLVAVGMASFPTIAYLYVAQCIRFVRYLRDWSETTDYVLSGILYFFVALIYHLTVISALLQYEDVRLIVLNTVAVVAMTTLLYRINKRASRAGRVTLLTPSAAAWHRYYAKRNAVQPPIM